MSRFKTINDICNQVAVEVGIPRASDAFSATDVAFSQLTTLANACGIEMLQNAAWEGLVREFKFTTQSGDTGVYALPDDFGYMINQTGWDQTNNVPMLGPLGAQQWAYLKGRDLVSQTIYASFRELENKLFLFPQPPPVGLDISFEYISRNWVNVKGQPDQYADFCDSPADVVLYSPHLFERLLKLRFLQARGFDTTVAQNQFEVSFTSWTAKDKGAPVLNAGRGGRGMRYLDGYGNTPDTRFGQ